MDIKKRLRNYGFWVSVAAFIPVALQTFGIKVLPSNYDQFVNGLLAILVMAGILNNPTTETRGFWDDPCNRDLK